MALSDPTPGAAIEGLVFRPGFLSPEEEAELLIELEQLRFDPIVMRGQTARRTARRFGVDYDYDSRTPKPGEPLPDWLERLRSPLASLAEVEPSELVAALVQRYPVGSTIGWHSDAPAFGLVVGLSVGGACRMRFRRPKEPALVEEIWLDARSAYVLRGAARWSWQHSIPATKEERYSITFRTLRRSDTPSP